MGTWCSTMNMFQSVMAAYCLNHHCPLFKQNIYNLPSTKLHASGSSLWWAATQCIMLCSPIFLGSPLVPSSRIKKYKKNASNSWKSCHIRNGVGCDWLSRKANNSVSFKHGKNEKRKAVPKCQWTATYAAEQQKRAKTSSKMWGKP